MDVPARVEAWIRANELIPPGGAVTALVSGGADSTCLWHVLGALGYRVSALHVDHGLRGDESDEDARFCREVLGAEVVDGRGGSTEDELRAIRYSFATDSSAGDRAHGLRPGRDRPLPARLARRRVGDRGEARRRRRAPAARADARRDGGLLRRGRARVSHRQLERGHEARPDPRADPAPPERAPPRRGAEPALAPRRGRLAARAPRRARV